MTSRPNLSDTNKAKTKENPMAGRCKWLFLQAILMRLAQGRRPGPSSLETEAGNCMISFQASLGYRMRPYLKQTNGPNWQVFFKPKLK